MKKTLNNILLQEVLIRLSLAGRRAHEEAAEAREGLSQVLQTEVYEWIVPATIERRIRPSKKRHYSADQTES